MLVGIAFVVRMIRVVLGKKNDDSKTQVLTRAESFVQSAQLWMENIAKSEEKKMGSDGLSDSDSDTEQEPEAALPPGTRKRPVGSSQDSDDSSDEDGSSDSEHSSSSSDSPKLPSNKEEK